MIRREQIVAMIAGIVCLIGLYGLGVAAVGGLFYLLADSDFNAYDDQVAALPEFVSPE